MRTRRNGWATTLGVVVLMALLALVGCASEADNESSDGDRADTDGGDGADEAQSEPQPGGRVVFGLSAETDGFNPAANRWGPSAFNVARTVYDPLTVVDTDGIAQPYLIESIEPDETLQEWTLTLRDEEIRFHNGDVFTTEILATFLKTMQLSPLAGFAFDPVQFVAVIDEKQVLVRSEEPWGTFPAMLSGQPGYLVHPDFLDGTIDEPLGTGPFVWGDWARDDSLTVERNDDYWREGLPYLDQVEFRPLADPVSRRASLDSGDLDLLHSNAPADLIEVGKDGAGVNDGQQVIFDGSAGDEQHMALNTQTGPTSDPNIRRALALATDRQAIVDGIYEGFFETADGPYSPDSFWWSDAGWPEPDPEEAARLVEAWEEENGEELSISLTVVANAENLELAQVIQEQWQLAGIDAQVQALPESEFANALLFGEFDAMMSQFYNRSDPDEHFHFWDPIRIGGEGELSLNFPRWTNDVVSESLSAARATNDREERKALYAQVWQEWAQEFPLLWIYHGQWMVIASEDIRGLDAFTLPNGDPAEPMDWGAVFLTAAWID